MGQMIFAEFYTLCKEAVDARKSNSKSPHINKVEKECREKWNTYTNGESKVLGFSNGEKMYVDSSVRAAYTAFFLDLCGNESYLSKFEEKGYFYSPEILVGDKEWEKDFVQVGENKFFHVDCQVFVFLLKAVRAIIDLGEENLLNEFSILYGSLDENAENKSPTVDKEEINPTTSEIDLSLLEKMLDIGNGILFRVEKDAIRSVIRAYKTGSEIDQEQIKRSELACNRLKKSNLL